MKKQAISLILAAAMLVPGASALQADEVSEASAAQITFGEVDGLVRENNKNVRACLESLASLDAFDRKKAYNALVDTYNGISRIDLTGSMSGTLSTLDDQLDALEEDEYAKTYEDSARQIESTVNTIVVGTENLYVTIAGLENSLEQAEISLGTLNRGLAAAEAATRLGQSSTENVRELKEKKNSLESTIGTLESSIKSCKESFAYLIGRESAEEIELAGFETVTQEALEAIDLEADIAAGLEKNLTVYQKRRAAEDAQDEYNDTHGGRYVKQMAQHNLESAKQAAKDAEESYRVSVRSAYDTLLEKDRLRGVAAETLAYEERSCEIAEKKYALGMIGREALRTAQDSRDAALLKLEQAETDCAAAYRTYCWAADGIV